MEKYQPGDWITCLLGKRMISCQVICYEPAPYDNLILVQKTITNKDNVAFMEKFFVDVSNPNFLLYRVGMTLDDLVYEEGETRSQKCPQFIVPGILLQKMIN